MPHSRTARPSKIAWREMLLLPQLRPKSPDACGSALQGEPYLRQDRFAAEYNGFLSAWWPWLVGLLALLSRFLFRSSAYFVDGPRHVAAIESGAVLIQPPGYFLFGELGRLLVGLTGASPSAALFSINAVFSALGAVVFAYLARRMFPGMLGAALSVFYAFSVTVWFDAEIHSTYAAMTLFAPLLLYTLFTLENAWLAGLTWALMTGFRPSDGVFVLPLVAWVLYRKGSRSSFRFLLVAAPCVALWYLPTVRHFGGHWLAPLSSAKGQANALANGFLIPGVPLQRKIGNLIHIMLGVYNAWGVLTIFVLSGLAARRSFSTYALLWILPGALFFLLYFFSDSLYLTYMIAPGLLAAGEALRRLRAQTAVGWVAAALLLSVGQMTLTRPVAPVTLGRAIVDSYLLQYSGWSVRHQYHQRLQDAVTTLHK